MDIIEFADFDVLGAPIHASGGDTNGSARQRRNYALGSCLLFNKARRDLQEVFKIARLLPNHSVLVLRIASVILSSLSNRIRKQPIAMPTIISVNSPPMTFQIPVGNSAAVPAITMPPSSMLALIIALP
jgi:hypothetical protein